jgi:hypothetical protein
MKSIKVLSISIGLMALVGCAHHRDVRPSADGNHRVVIVAEDKEQGAREASKQAQHYCQESNRSYAVVSENAKYTGSMSEESYNATKTGAKIAKGVGGTVWALGGRNESNAGGVVGLGGAIADDVAGKGYTVEMIFKCM